jgi:ubiquitin C-terminal hydrolase
MLRFLAHDGGFRGGHYRAVVRNNVNQWILFDDEYVSYVYSLNSYQSTVYQLTFLRVEP